MAELTKIGIIGMGHVGAHVANAILYQGLAAELHCVDKIESKVACEVNDLQDAMPFYPRMARVYNHHANYEELLDCDVIVNAAGHVAAVGENRDGELFVTADEAKEIAPHLKGYEGVVVSIANPCDVVATLIQQGSGIDPTRVIGSGTALDSARLRHALWTKTGYNPNSITAWMLGEHGASQFAAWSHVFFGATPLAELEASGDERFQFDHDEVAELARDGGFVTYRGKQCTEYSIANAATSIVAAVINDTKLITPCGVMLTGRDDEYGESGHYTSLPCVIGKDGMEGRFPLELSADEQELFHASCAHIKENLAKVS